MEPHRKILVLGDHAIRISHIAEVLAKNEWSTIVQWAPDPDENLVPRDDAPHFVFLIYSHETDHLRDLIRRTLRGRPQTHVFVLDLSEMVQDLEDELRSGRLCLALGRESPKELVKRLNRMASDVLSPGHARPRAITNPAMLETNLTRRERAICKLIGEGLSNRGIAERLKVSPNTIKNRIHHILQKLDVPSRHAAARKLQLGHWSQCS
jgi:DNA-binding NarL/FixJ family response regulator